MTAGGLILPFEGHTPRISPTAWIAPNAVIIGNVEIGDEASVWFGAVIRGDDLDHTITIGRRSNVQDNAVVHVSARGPTILESDVTVGHGATLESCYVGSNCLIGMNAVVLPESRLGSDCLVAAGALVREESNVPSGSLVVGVPGRVRPLTPTARAWVERGASHYVQLSRRYMSSG